MGIAPSVYLLPTPGAEVKDGLLRSTDRSGGQPRRVKEHRLNFCLYPIYHPRRGASKDKVMVCSGPWSIAPITLGFYPFILRPMDDRNYTFHRQTLPGPSKLP